MPDLAVAERYAQALIELGDEEGLVERFAADLGTFTALSQQDDVDLVATLGHPAFTLDERRAVLEDVLGQLGLHAHSANFLRIVLEKGRFPALPHIVDAYVRSADALAGRVRATVTTATPLSASLESEVKAALESATGKTVLVESKVDPLIIGGVVAQVEGRVFDASLRTRLLALRQSLLSSNPDQAYEA
jgi:F-type H+-transporting ATPase subunit delta